MLLAFAPGAPPFGHSQFFMQNYQLTQKMREVNKGIKTSKYHDLENKIRTNIMETSLVQKYSDKFGNSIKSCDS